MSRPQVSTRAASVHEYGNFCVMPSACVRVFGTHGHSVGHTLDTVRARGRCREFCLAFRAQPLLEFLAPVDDDGQLARNLFGLALNHGKKAAVAQVPKPTPEL